MSKSFFPLYWSNALMGILSEVKFFYKKVIALSTWKVNPGIQYWVLFTVIYTDTLFLSRGEENLGSRYMQILRSLISVIQEGEIDVAKRVAFIGHSNSSDHSRKKCSLPYFNSTHPNWRNKWKPVDGYENTKGLREEKNRKMLFSIFGTSSYLHLLFPNGESKQFETQPLGVPTLLITAPCFRMPPECSVSTWSRSLRKQGVCFILSVVRSASLWWTWIYFSYRSW